MTSPSLNPLSGSDSRLVRNSRRGEGFANGSLEELQNMLLSERDLRSALVQRCVRAEGQVYRLLIEAFRALQERIDRTGEKIDGEDPLIKELKGQIEINKKLLDRLPQLLGEIQEIISRVTKQWEDYRDWVALYRKCCVTGASMQLFTGGFAVISLLTWPIPITWGLAAAYTFGIGVAGVGVYHRPDDPKKGIPAKTECVRKRVLENLPPGMTWDGEGMPPPPRPLNVLVIEALREKFRELLQVGVEA